MEWKFLSQDVGHRTLKGESPRNILGFIRERVQCYHGDYGVACVQQSLNGSLCSAKAIIFDSLCVNFDAVKYHNVLTLMTILRCPRAHHEAVWSALSGVTAFKKEPCSLLVVHVAGTIRSAQQALVQHNLALLKKELSTASSQGRMLASHFDNVAIVK